MVIYVASSWKNEFYEGVLDCLDQWALPYYNWRDEKGFHWSDVDPDYNTRLPTLMPRQYLYMVGQERAREGFDRDMHHLRQADAVILLLPCGRSAHLEAGWAVGAGKPVAIYLREQPVVPELMYKMADLITDDIDELMRWSARAHVGWPA